MFSNHFVEKESIDGDFTHPSCALGACPSDADEMYTVGHKHHITAKR